MPAVPGRAFGTSGYFGTWYCLDEHAIEGLLAGLKKAA